jgi:hypothetical protein
MIWSGELSAEQGLYLMGRIKGPDEIWLSQLRVNDYAHFARQVYARHKRDHFNRAWLSLAEVSSEIVTPVVAAAAAMMNPISDPMILPESGAIEVQQLIVPNGWGGLMQVEHARRLPRLGHR